MKDWNLGEAGNEVYSQAGPSGIVWLSCGEPRTVPQCVHSGKNNTHFQLHDNGKKYNLFEFLGNNAQNADRALETDRKLRHTGQFILYAVPH